MSLTLIGVTAFVTSLVSGMLGLGGAVLLIPAYLYLPRLFAIAPLDMRSISGMTSVQVLASALLGMWTHGSRGSVDSRLALTMGVPITAASFAGAMLSGVVHPDVIVGVFGCMALLGALLMLAAKEPAAMKGPLAYDARVAVTIAVVVGLFGGIVGAPGAFLLSPLMIAVLKVPTRMTVGTTMAIVVLSALAASAGKLVTSQVPLVETTVAVMASLPGVHLGSRFSYVCPPRVLRWVIAVVIFGVGIEMWYQILF